MTIEFTPTGRSMLPFIRPGDNVKLEIGKRDIRNFDVVLYKKNDKSILHRVVGKKADGYIICGDNESTADFVVPEQIIGIMVQHQGRKHVRTEKTLAWCWYRLKVKQLARLMKNFINKGRRMKNGKTF